MPPMKFSQKIILLQHRPWSRYYLDYNGLKRILAEVDDDDDDGNDDEYGRDIESAPADGAAGNGGGGSAVVRKGGGGEISLLEIDKLKDEAGTSARFVRRLNREVDKISLFVMKEQGKVADELAVCDEERRRLLASSLRASSSSSSSPSSGGAGDGAGGDGSDAQQRQQQEEEEKAAKEKMEEEKEKREEEKKRRLRSLRDSYNRIGADLLHLIQFVDLNVKGIERILKKHDKRVFNQRYPQYDIFLGLRGGSGNSRSAAVMAPLLRGEPLAALCVILQNAFTELRLRSAEREEDRRRIEQRRLFTTGDDFFEDEVLSLEEDRTEERGRSRKKATAAKLPWKKRGRSPKALPRRFRSSQALQDMAKEGQRSNDGVVDDVDGGKDLELARSGDADDRFVAMSATDRRNTDRHGGGGGGGVVPSPTSRADDDDDAEERALPLRHDDFIMAQIYAARRALKAQQASNGVVDMLAATALGFPAVPPDIHVLGPPRRQESAIQAEYDRAAALAAYKRSSSVSSTLNYVSSFIYMANYLIVVPTVVTYSEKLGSDPAYSSFIVGMTPFATIFSTIVYSWWTSYSYRYPLLLASSLNVVGNFVYAMGYPLKSMECVLLGRLLSGLGSCRPINRRYIADAYSTADRTAASAHFVAVGSFGMALGPFLGSLLHRAAENSTSVYWQVENAPGWFMCGVWAVYVVFHVLFFVDPPRERDDEAASTNGTASTTETEMMATTPSSVSSPSKEVDGKVMSTDVTVAATGETKPLLGKQQRQSSHQLADERSAASDESARIPIWRNAAIMTNFYIYFIEKLLMECVSSSTSILTYYYFDWPGSWAGYYLSFLCLLVLPVNLFVAYLSKVYEDRQMMVVMQAATVLGCLVIIRYGPNYDIEQYLLGSMMIVVFSNMVEGPNMSLLSKTIPKSWRKGFLNVGLLATEAATLGRTAGDAFLALCGAGGLENQLNYTFGSMAVITALTLWISFRFYDKLIPTEDKDL